MDPPSYRTDVVLTASGTALRMRTAATATSTATALRFSNTTVNDAAGGYSSYIEGVRTNVPATGAQALAFGTSASSAAPVERMRLDPNGYLGIGTTSPATALDVSGALSVRGMAAPVVSPTGQGRIYFDSTTNKFRASENAGAYVDLVSAGGGVPAGAVSFFNLASCPAGWTALTAAEGRFLVGLPVGGTLAGTAGATAFTNLANPFNTPVSHGHNVPGHVAGGTIGAHIDDSHAGEDGDYNTGTTSAGSASTHTPPYIQLLVCQKS